MGELILAIKDEVVRESFANWNGFVPSFNVVDFVNSLGDKVEEIDRDKLEGNPTYRQLIPYVVFVKDGKIFNALRGGKEKRLHGFRTLGFAGHSRDLQEDNLYEILLKNTYREIDEELKVSNFENFPVGFIYSNASDVNRDHLGIVFMVATDSVALKSENTDGKLSLLSELNFDDFEPWSQFLIKFLRKSGFFELR